MIRQSTFEWKPEVAGEYALENLSLSTGADCPVLEDQIRAVFLAWRDPVYRYLLSVAESPTDAEDLTQETFIRLFQDLQKGQTINNLRAWLFRVAHNLAIDLARKPSRTRAAGNAEKAIEERIDPAPSAERQLIERERMNRLLDRLSPQERRCMELRTEGLRYREIASVLGIGVPTVQTALCRAVRKLAGETQ